MIIQEADRPLAVFCQLEVSLPEAVAMLPLESTLTPNLLGASIGLSNSASTRIRWMVLWLTGVTCKEDRDDAYDE